MVNNTVVCGAILSITLLILMMTQSNGQEAINSRLTENEAFALTKLISHYYVTKQALPKLANDLTIQQMIDSYLPMGLPDEIADELENLSGNTYSVSADLEEVADIHVIVSQSSNYNFLQPDQSDHNTKYRLVFPDIDSNEDSRITIEENAGKTNDLEFETSNEFNLSDNSNNSISMVYIFTFVIVLENGDLFCHSHIRDGGLNAGGIIYKVYP